MTDIKENNAGQSESYNIDYIGDGLINVSIYYNEYLKERFEKQIHINGREAFYTIKNGKNKYESNWWSIDKAGKGIEGLNKILKRLKVEKSRCNNYGDKNNKELQESINNVKKGYTDMINSIKKEKQTILLSQIE